MRRLALGFALGMAVVLLILPSIAVALTSHGHGAAVVASRGTVVVVPRSSVVVSRSSVVVPRSSVVVVSRSSVVVPRSSVVVPRSSVVVVPRSSVVVSRRVFVGARFFVGPVWWGPGWYPYSYPYYDPYPASYAAPAVVQQAAPAYAQPTPAAQYWYYCPDSRAYYPYTQQCPSEWLQVVPAPPPPLGYSTPPPSAPTPEPSTLTAPPPANP